MIKQLEADGLAFEGAEASFELLIRRRTAGYVAPFRIVDFTVLVEQREGRELLAEATVKVQVEGEVLHTAADGNGPVNALDAALRKALRAFYPQLDGVHLVDYKVRILDGNAATAARTRDVIDSAMPPGPGARWVDTNIIAASAAALADSLEYAIWKSGAECGVATSATSPSRRPPGRAMRLRPAGPAGGSHEDTPTRHDGPALVVELSTGSSGSPAAVVLAAGAHRGRRRAGAPGDRTLYDAVDAALLEVLGAASGAGVRVHARRDGGRRRLVELRRPTGVGDGGRADGRVRGTARHSTGGRCARPTWRPYGRSSPTTPGRVRPRRGQCRLAEHRARASAPAPRAELDETRAEDPGGSWFDRSPPVRARRAIAGAASLCQP